MTEREAYRNPDGIPALFRKLGIEYIPRPRFLYDISSFVSPQASDYYRLNRKEFDGLTRKYGALIAASSTADVYVARTEEMGFGLFAGRTLGKGTFIGEYTGLVRIAEDCPAPEAGEDDTGLTEGFATDYSWGYPDYIDGVTLEVDARTAGNALRFVNHNFRPNLTVEHTIADGVWAVFFIAGKKIRKDEQLFADYGIEYWSGGYRELVL